jgi:Tfp pilus assembly protein PilX
MKIKNLKFKIKNCGAGSILIYNVVIIFIFSLVMLGLLAYATIQLRVVRSTVSREQAFQIAEAGANYYEWHLAHFAADYWDGQASSTPGPYVHDYVDTDTNQKIGQFSLSITPPPVGSSIVTVESTGYTLDSPNQKRTITVRYGTPSLGKFAFLTNNYVHVGSASTFYGQFHSNSGIQFDGTATAAITSARSTYTCSSDDGCSGSHPGIWGSASAATKAFWQFPVPNMDYSAITADLATIKAGAQSDGLYLPPSSALGYSLVFINNGTFKVYKVTSLNNDPVGYDVDGHAHNKSIDYLGRSEQTGVCDPYPCQMPDNGLIYVEDNVWVEGVVNGRALVAAAQLPYQADTASSVMIQNNLTYAAKDGSDSLGLIGQQDVLLSYLVPNNLEVDAALIAQNGSFQRFRFPGSLKNQLTVYGSMSSFGQAAVYYGDSGFQTRNYTFDSNLLYGPPPGFPLSSSGYQQISWSSN